MSRNATPRQQPLEVVEDATAHQAASDALNALSENARAIMANYSLASANPEVLVAEIKGFQASAVDAMFNIGVRLMLLRTVTPNGQWLATLGEVGINDRAARRIVMATIKYNDPRKQRSEKLLALGKGKLIELLTLDDDSIDALDKGGQIGELDLDEIARMSPTELRGALREAKADNQAKDSLVESKNKKIDDLDIKLKAAKKFKPKPDAEAQTLHEQNQLDELAAATREAEVAIARLAVVVRDIFEEGSSEAVSTRAMQALTYVGQRMKEIAEEHGLSKIKGDVPAWLKK